MFVWGRVLLLILKFLHDLSTLYYHNPQGSRCLGFMSWLHKAIDPASKMLVEEEEFREAPMQLYTESLQELHIQLLEYCILTRSIVILDGSLVGLSAISLTQSFVVLQTEDKRAY